MIYFTSDLHLGHLNIIEACQRPFHSLKEMNETLINNHNKIVKPTDDIFYLGDLFWKPEYIILLEQLNGRKYLIKGNHERNWVKYYEKNKDDFNNQFEWIKDYYELKYNKQRFILFHYPIESWNGRWRGTIHLHGHTHNRENPIILPNRYNVGIDVNNLFPISIENIVLFF